MGATIQAPNVPDYLRLHEEDKERRAKEHAEKQPELDRCLDPDYAAQVESRKPLHSYQISCVIQKRNDRGKFVPTKIEGEVRGQNPDDAWARFCDLHGVYPSPTHCQRVITKVDPETGNEHRQRPRRASRVDSEPSEGS